MRASVSDKRTPRLAGKTRRKRREGEEGREALEREEGGGGVKEGVAGCHVMPACENGGTRGTKVPRESAAAERQFRDVAVTVSRFDASVSR